MIIDSNTAKTLSYLGFQPFYDYVLYEDRIEWLSNDPQPTEAEIDEAAPAAARAALKATAYRECARRLDAVVAMYSPIEVRDWTELAKEAAEYPGTVGPKLTAKQAAGFDLAEYVPRVLANASVWPPVEEAIQHTRDLVKAWIDAQTDEGLILLTDADVSAKYDELLA